MLLIFDKLYIYHHFHDVLFDLNELPNIWPELIQWDGKWKSRFLCFCCYIKNFYSRDQTYWEATVVKQDVKHIWLEMSIRIQKVLIEIRMNATFKYHLLNSLTFWGIKHDSFEFWNISVPCSYHLPFVDSLLLSWFPMGLVDSTLLNNSIDAKFYAKNWSSKEKAKLQWA